LGIILNGTNSKSGIDAHREGEGKQRLLQANLKKLVNKNAIKPKIGDSPW
jgi:hypothetical protein